MDGDREIREDTEGTAVEGEEAGRMAAREIRENRKGALVERRGGR